MANPLFDALLGRHGDSNATLFDAATPGLERAISYREFAAMSGQAAHSLIKLGVRPGDRVMMQAEKSIDMLALYMGTIRAGAIFVPVNTAYTAAEVGYFLGDAEPSVFICENKGVETSVKTMNPDEWRAFQEITCSAIYATERSVSDIAAILYTSGTTGRSKGAMLTHDNLLSNAESLKTAWRFTSDDVLLHTLPIYHAHGLFVATHTAMLAGASIIFEPKFSTAAVVSQIDKASVLMGVPTHYTRLLDDDRFTKEKTANMRLFTSGSAPLLASTHKAFSQRTGHMIVERYGLTETTMNSSNPYDKERRPGTVGFALPDVEIRLGSDGEILVRGPNVFAGYWRKPEKTYAEFDEDGFFKTGDLGSFDEDGYLTIIGRKKDLVISGGLNVYPKEVEEAIDAIEGVMESAVIGLPHVDFGEAVTAIVVLDDGVRDVDIIGQLKHRLASFKCPKKIIIVDEIRRNSMGKVQKNLLRDEYHELYSQGG